MNDLTLPNVPEHFSVTQAQMVLRCPIQWWFRYALGQKTRPSWAMVGGSAMDETMNHHHELRLGGSREPYLEDYYSERLATLAEEKEPDGAMDYDYTNKGPLGVRAYLQDADPYINPVEVQPEILEPYHGVPMLKGYLDLIHVSSAGQRVIHDLKFSGRVQTADNSLQLHVYDDVKGTGLRHVQMCTIVKNVKPKVVFLDHFVTDKDRRQARHTMSRAWNLVNAAIQANDPSLLSMADYRNQRGPWPCSEKWCGMWKMCRGSESGLPEFPLPIRKED